MSQVSASEDIVKHVKTTLVHGERIDGTAFLPRDCDNGKSSVHRLRVFSDDDDVAMCEVRRRSRLTLRAGHRFAQINVGEIKRVVNDVAAVTVVADPLPANEKYPDDASHALIDGLSHESLLNDLIGDLISLAVSRLHPAV